MQLENDQHLYNTVLSAPIGICILDAATLTSEIVNDKFLEVAGKPYEAIFGQFYWDSFAEARPYYEEALAGVVRNGEAYHADEVELLLIRNGQPEMVFVTFVYSPIKDATGKVIKVAVWVLENTAQVKARQQVEQANDALKASQENIRNMVRQAPVGMCIVSGEPLFVEVINDLFLEIIGKKREEFDKTPYWEVNAEAKAFYEPITDHVLQTGETYYANEHELLLIRKGTPKTVYVDFVYEPMRDADGKVTTIMIVATEVTDKVLSRRALLEINNEMAASNEEMAASNEELIATNEELAEAQHQLQQSLASLTESEERFRTMAEGSGILIAVGDETSNATYFNKAWVELTGRSMEYLLEFGWIDLVHPDDRESYVNIYLEAFKNEAPFTGEFRVLDKKGEYRWLLANGSPRFRPDGSFAGYISSCIDITERKKEEEERQGLLNAIKDNEAKLDQLINQLPASITVLIGKDFVVERTNPSNLAYWQKSGEDVIGKPLLEVLPELADQAFPGQLKHVLDTGETIFEEEHPVHLEGPDGKFNTTYVDYSYQPLTDKDGKRIGVLVMSNDITEKVESRRMLEKYASELQQINEEMVASNEELLTTNEELFTMQQTLENSIKELAESEARFRNLVQIAPVGIAIFNGRKLVIESANNEILRFWGKGAEVIGKRLSVAVPELEGQPFLDLLDQVYVTGEAYYGVKTVALLEQDGVILPTFYDFIYQPIAGENGQTVSLMVVAIDVTEQVNAKKAVGRAEEMLRLAIDAAGIGTWHIDPQTKALKYNSVLAKLFGYEDEAPMTYDMAIGQVSDEFRDKITNEIEKTIASGNEYDITYSQYRFNDNELIWLRSLGKISQDEQGNYTIFSGVVMDITEQKADEQRKNDFIGMVSHELKTPLTSLTAIVQVANAKLKTNPDAFLVNAMEKANLQVKRMGNMINGFLNVSRLESGKMFVIKQDFDLDELIKEVIAESELTISTHIIHTNICDSVTANADHDKISSVVSNLLSNAVKYSPKGKNIYVKCEIKGKSAEVSVKDEGMGIKPQDIEHVFDRYFRAQTNHTKHISGFGIGLYLSAEIIKQHNGKIWVESESGVGSTFYFSLPLK